MHIQPLFNTHTGIGRALYTAQPCMPRRSCRCHASAGHAEGQQAVPALKEWAVTCEALGAGEQTILVRKGGIREPTFKPKSSQFMLLPTAFHERAELLQPGIAERYKEAMALDPQAQAVLQLPFFAQVRAAWSTSDPRLLDALPPGLHVWQGKAFLETRLKWRRGQPMTLMEVRMHRLRQPLALPTSPELWGCFSWVDVPASVATPERLADRVAVLTDADFGEKQRLLRQGLEGLDVSPLQLPVSSITAQVAAPASL